MLSGERDLNGVNQVSEYLLVNIILWGFLGGSDSKESACNAVGFSLWVQSLGWVDPLEKGMDTHCRILS